MWNTYEQVRDLLDKQYRQGDFAQDTGLPLPELESGLEAYYASHRDQPRILLKAGMFAWLVNNAQIRVDAFDWFADHIATGRLMWKYQGIWFREEAKTVPPSQFAGNPIGFPTLDLSHTTLGWRQILQYGIRGIIERAENSLQNAKDSEADNLFKAIITVYKAIRNTIDRLAKEARRVNAARVVSTLEFLVDNPPETFQQALQLAFIYNQMQEIEGEYVRSQGVFDQLFFPYYQRDLDEGRLSRNQAKELIKFFFDKFSSQHFGAGNNFCFGGRRADGSDCCNDLTVLCLEAFAERKNIDPKFSLRIHANTPDAIMKQACECIKAGTNAIVFANDDIAYPMFLKHGKELEDIVDFVPIGCYEPAIMGKELSCSMSATYNLAKIAEYAIQELAAPASFEEVIAFCKAKIQATLSETLARACAFERTWSQVNPSPVLSGTLDSCFEKGRDVSNAGTKYSTSGVMCAGLGTLVDSLAAIQFLVFEKRHCSWAELQAAVQGNWEGKEHLRRLAIKHAPKWGNNNPKADQLAVELTSDVASIINSTPNTRGGHFQMGCWSIDYTHTFGRTTKATPDGRKNGDVISKNLCATVGADRNGVTALVASAAKLDHTDFADGSVLDILLHPSAVMGADGADVIAQLVKTFFDQGGFFCHFNVLDAQTLKNAQLEPAKYSTLQVRVCGWNTRFVDLSREMQDMFIAQAEG